MVRSARGDTLVEVLMAIVIISVVIVGAVTMMTRGLAAAQIALEHSQVRLSINSQVDMLRYARDRYIAAPTGGSATAWNQVIAGSNQSSIVYDNNCTVSPSKTGFYMTAPAASVVRNNYTPTQPATIAVPGQGLWVEGVLSPNTVDPAYIDVVVRACWQGSGGGGQQSVVTATRLYDPSR